MLELLTSPEAWLNLLTLSVLEIVLGVDNIIVISILTDKLPHHQRPRARFIGLSLAMITRILLLTTISFLASLTAPWFSLGSIEISGRDLVLILGGAFLVYKSISEMIEKFHNATEEHDHKVKPNFWSIITQIIILDIVFSLDSVITAIGLSNHLPIMVTAIIIAVLIMMFLAKPIADIIHRFPSLKFLALSFLVLIGGVLIAEGFELHVEKSYVYVAMAFSVIVETINIRYRLAVRQGHHPKDKAEQAAIAA